MQLIEGTKGRRHRLVSIFNNMQTAESLKMQSVMLGGAADPSAFMTEVGPFQYEAFRCDLHHITQKEKKAFTATLQKPPESGNSDIHASNSHIRTEISVVLAV